MPTHQFIIVEIIEMMKHVKRQNSCPSNSKTNDFNKLASNPTAPSRPMSKSPSPIDLPVTDSSTFIAAWQRQGEGHRVADIVDGEPSGLSYGPAYERQHGYSSLPRKMTARDRSMELTSALAEVLEYSRAMEEWVKQGVCRVEIVKNVAGYGFVMVARNLHDKNMVMACDIDDKIRYKYPSTTDSHPTFHIIRDSDKIYGLNFSHIEDGDDFAQAFFKCQQLLKMIKQQKKAINLRSSPPPMPQQNEHPVSSGSVSAFCNSLPRHRKPENRQRLTNLSAIDDKQSSLPLSISTSQRVPQAMSYNSMQSHHFSMKSGGGTTSISKKNLQRAASADQLDRDPPAPAHFRRMMAPPTLPELPMELPKPAYKVPPCLVHEPSSVALPSPPPSATSSNQPSFGYAISQTTTLPSTSHPKPSVIDQQVPPPPPPPPMAPPPPTPPQFTSSTPQAPSGLAAALQAAKLKKAETTGDSGPEPTPVKVAKGGDFLAEMQRKFSERRAKSDGVGNDVSRVIRRTNSDTSAIKLDLKNTLKPIPEHKSNLKEKLRRTEVVKMKEEIIHGIKREINDYKLQILQIIRTETAI